MTFQAFAPADVTGTVLGFVVLWQAFALFNWFVLLFACVCIWAKALARTALCLQLLAGFNSHLSNLYAQMINPRAQMIQSSTQMNF